jgi:hypothetical protein
MPVDTLSKRVSALAMSFPLPDGTLTAPDRQHVLWTYTGIAAAPPVPTVIFGQLLVLSRPLALLLLRRPHA